MSDQEQPLCGGGVYLRHPDPLSPFYAACEDYGVQMYANILPRGAELWLCERHNSAMLDAVAGAFEDL